MKKYISIILTIMCILSFVGCSKKEKQEIEILIPAGSTEAFVYSETEIRPIGNKITIWSGAGLGDTEVRKTEYEGAPLAPEVTDKDLESVSYIEVMSGLTGQRIKVKDTVSVQKVMEDIKSLKYVKKNAVEEIDYAYRIRFYNENNDILGRIFITEENGHKISYDGYYYLVKADQNINVNFLEELLKNAPPAEPGDEGNDELHDTESVETVTYNEKEYIKSELCDDTLEWLELSEQEKMWKLLK